MAAWPYNTGQWARLRKIKLDAEPLCQPCKAAGRMTTANTVDHNHPISDGGPAFPGLDGLTAMCAPCHSAKTARGSEAGAVRTTRALRPRKGCDASGRPTDPSHPWNEKSLRADPDQTAVPQNSQLVYKRSRLEGQ